MAKHVSDNMNLTKFSAVMISYIIITYLVAPAAGYWLFGQTVTAAGNGFIFGSILSIVLWKLFGERIVRGEIMSIIDSRALSK